MRATRTILVEDTLKNLKTAKQLHMKTVHIFHRGTPFSSMQRMRPAYVDLRVNSVQQLLTHPFACQPDKRIGRRAAGLSGPRALTHLRSSS